MLNIYRTVLVTVRFLVIDAKEELKRALLEYKGSVLLIFHEPRFSTFSTKIFSFPQNKKVLFI